MAGAKTEAVKEGSNSTGEAKKLKTMFQRKGCFNFAPKSATLPRIAPRQTDFATIAGKLVTNLPIAPALAPSQPSSAILAAESGTSKQIARRSGFKPKQGRDATLVAGLATLPVTAAMVVVVVMEGLPLALMGRLTEAPVTAMAQ
ncbi:hypothetical protein FRC01_010513 [Tulasnella sp. 417]|nr:hypothetical protein FRC01_010513 [Tulasnella sp. 417]